MIKCHRCGELNRENSKICINCDARLGSESQSNQYWICPRHDIKIPVNQKCPQCESIIKT